MTLGGLALAIGMLVDDATVEVENINRNRRTEPNLLRAILDGARQVALPALAATATICIVFLPVVVLTGPAKYLFVPLALSVVFAMVASYVLSRTLVPTLAAMLLGKEEPEAEERSPIERDDRPGLVARVDRRRRAALERLRTGYASALASFSSDGEFVLGIALAVLAASACLVAVVGLDFFPAVDAGLMRIHFRAPSGTRIEETERLVDAVEAADSRDRAARGASRRSTTTSACRSSTTSASFRRTTSTARTPRSSSRSRHSHRPTREYADRIRRVVHARAPGHDDLLPAGRHRRPGPEFRAIGADRRADRGRRLACGGADRGAPRA